MTIIQLIETLAYGDGMGNHTILTHNLLKQRGFNVVTYAVNILPNVPKGIAEPFRSNIVVNPEDIILFQFGIGGTIPNCITSFACRKILVYHNVTPESFFEGYDREAYKFTAEARQLAREWAEMNVFDAVLALSKYNYNELLEMGYSASRLHYFPGYLIPLHEYNEAPDMDTVEDYDDGVINILFVGRISPQKKQEDIIRAFAYYHNNINANSRLILVGGGKGSMYGKALLRYIDDLNLENNVVIPDHIPFASLIAIYKCADVFVCMSEHEGFCIPLIEAMLFDVPVLAFNAAAVPDTLEDSGVLLNKKDPIIVAKWIECIINDKDLREKIVEQQRKRRAFFAQDDAEQEMIRFLNKFIEENILKYQYIDETGAHERQVGELIDGALYDIVAKKLTEVGKRMPMSRWNYLSTMKKA